MNLQMEQVISTDTIGRRHALSNATPYLKVRCLEAYPVAIPRPRPSCNADWHGNSRTWWLVYLGCLGTILKPYTSPLAPRKPRLRTGAVNLGPKRLNIMAQGSGNPRGHCTTITERSGADEAAKMDPP